MVASVPHPPEPQLDWILKVPLPLFLEAMPGMQLALIGSMPCPEVVKRQEFFAFCAPSAIGVIWYTLPAASSAWHCMCHCVAADFQTSIYTSCKHLQNFV